ncbi:SufE family protein [Rhodoblastus sp.]|uniref:SufE family protein n=1 Tax=Rhodoblastus sp. TaxID=1962975 RepID=UPI003F9B7548
MTLDEIIDNFEFLDDWDDRYRYLIDLGRTLAPMPDEAHNESNKVRCCMSQVWLETKVEPGPKGEPVLHFLGDSDALIVRGLVALTLVLFSGHTAREILDADALDLFKRLGFEQHLTPQRSNGLRSMVDRIRKDAAQALATA